MRTARVCACGLCLRHVNLEREPTQTCTCTANAPLHALHALCTCIAPRVKYPHQLPTPQPAATQCLQQHDTGYEGPCQEGAPRQEAQSAGRRTEKWAGSSNLLSTPSCKHHIAPMRPTSAVYPAGRPSQAVLCPSLPCPALPCPLLSMPPLRALNQGPLTRYLLSFQMTSLALGPSVAPPVAIKGK